MYLRIITLVSFLHLIAAKGTKPSVECVPDLMRVTVPLDGNRKMAYLDQMKDYTPCRPELTDGVATFNLDLAEPHKCGVTRILHSITGKRVFYHKIVVEDDDGSRETVTARCVVVPERVVKRAVELPPEFQEPELLEITTDYTAQAPLPQPEVVVKQNGKEISGEVSVNPGALLSMEIFLDNASAPVYGLMLGYMQVTDTKSQQETIILNGCSVDTYLFDNFVTTDGDRLTAKFRAFKFPDTNYVQFRGTVTACLDKCQGVQCSDGVTGYGRKKREISNGPDPKKVYEVSLTTFIKVENINGDKEAEEILAILKNLKASNQILDERRDNSATVHERKRHDIPEVQETKAENRAGQIYSGFALFLTLIVAFRW